MARIKSTDLQKDRSTKKDQLQKRRDEEARLKGSQPIAQTAPIELCAEGKTLYEEIVSTLPKNFLNNLDVTAVQICADAAAGMRKCQRILNGEGILVESPQGVKQNPALLAYSKYSDLFRRYADDLGLTPASRSKLALMKFKQEEEEADPLLKVLKKKKA